MTDMTLQLGVIIARRSAGGVWAMIAWRPVAVLPAPVALETGAPIAAAQGDELYYAGACDLALHRSDTGGYRDNLQGGQPCVWVTLAQEGEPPGVLGLTVDPYEGEALAEIHGARIEAVSMPRPIQETVAAFVARHHVERPFVKRKRR